MSVSYLVYASNRAQTTAAADTMASLGMERVVDSGSFGLLALAGADVE